MLKVKAKPTLDKTMERRVISLFKRYNIVDNIESDVTKSDTRIVIYPSVILAVAIEDVNSYHETIQNKLADYARVEDADEEVTNESAPD